MRKISVLLVAFILMFSSSVLSQQQPETQQEICTDGIDNDHDGLIDCYDDDCSALSFCMPAKTIQAIPENTPDTCRDGTDNDGDGGIDCNDEECSLFTFCVKYSSSPSVTPYMPAAGCTRDVDCKGSRVCVEGQCVERDLSTAGTSHPVSVRRGMGLFIPGLILSVVSLALYWPAYGIGMTAGNKYDSYFDDPEDLENFYEEDMAASIIIGSGAFAFSLTGGAMINGAQTIGFSATKRLGGNPVIGLLAAGWILYGISAVTGIGLYGAAAKDELALTYCDFDRYGENCLEKRGFFNGRWYLVFEFTWLAATIVSSVGWRIQGNRALKAAREVEKSGILVLPFMTAKRGGAVAGIIVAF